MTQEDLEVLRTQIDELDELIIALLAKRFVLSRATLREKGDYVRDANREVAVREHVAQVAERLGLDPRYAAAVYDVVLRISVEIQDESRKLRAV